MFGRVLIAGCGLMGASLGLAIKSRNLAGQVVGWDSDHRATAAALERGAIDQVATNPEAAAAEADLVVLAAYVKSLPELLLRLAPSVRAGTIMTDLGSVKGSIMAAAREPAFIARLSPGAVFVGGHPMAGKAAQGAVHADPELFTGTVWVLCPPPAPRPEEVLSEDGRLAVERLKALVGALGARPAVMTAEHHDRAVAAVSHLPQSVASALMNSAASLDQQTPGVLDLAASGFRDTTRIAASTPSMWRDICLDNREALLGTLEQFESELAAFRQALEAADAAIIEDFFERAKAAKEGMRN